MAKNSSMPAENKTNAKQILNQVKMEAAKEVGVDLKQGYNGDLTSRQAGSIGGQMVKKIIPIRTLSFDRHNRISKGHKITVRYSFSLSVQMFLVAYYDNKS